MRWLVFFSLMVAYNSFAGPVDPADMNNGQTEVLCKNKVAMVQPQQNYSIIVEVEGKTVVEYHKNCIDIVSYLVDSGYALQTFYVDAGNGFEKNTMDQIVAECSVIESKACQ